MREVFYFLASAREYKLIQLQPPLPPPKAPIAHVLPNVRLPYQLLDPMQLLFFGTRGSGALIFVWKCNDHTARESGG
jgi:hypothetical protein